jgi:hypothetical protein
MRTLIRVAAVASWLIPQIVFALPEVGDRLPDITVLDEAGKPFPLRDRLEGKPAVIVFGCLT